MFKWIKKLRARLTHKHEFEIIFSSHAVDMKKKKTGDFLQLHRCYCGTEKAFVLTMGRNIEISVDWLRAEIKRAGHKEPINR